MPYIIMVLGYTLLAMLFLWTAISIKGKWVRKFVVAPFVLWFGLFLYYVPPQLTGYPSDQELHEDKVVVRFFTYDPPTAKTEGNIYVIADTRFFKDATEPVWFDSINPLTYADISNDEFLRLYRLPWDEELVKEMAKAQKKKQMIILKKNKKGESENKDGSGGMAGKGKGKRGSNTGENGGKFGANDAQGKGGTGGTARNSKDTSRYSVQGLTPNEVFRK